MSKEEKTTLHGEYIIGKVASNKQSASIMKNVVCPKKHRASCHGSFCGPQYLFFICLYSIIIPQSCPSPYSNKMLFFNVIIFF